MPGFSAFITKIVCQSPILSYSRSQMAVMQNIWQTIFPSWAWSEGTWPNHSGYKYHLSLTNPRDALHYSKRAANKGGRSVW